MEKYLELIGACTTFKKNGTQKRINRITEKVERALELYPFDQNEENSRVVNLIQTCFDCGDGSHIKRISENYEPINYLRNDFQHEDFGLNKSRFFEKAGYLIEEEFGEEDHSGIFTKFVSIFRLPEDNIFDLLNERIITLLKKPKF